MNIDSALHQRLQQLARRQRRMRLWCSLALCWLGASLLGAGGLLLQRLSGWSSSLASPLLALLGLAGAVFVFLSRNRKPIVLRDLAMEVEKRYPILEGRLLTAVQQQPKSGAQLSYLQDRLVRETIQTTNSVDWLAVIPTSRLAIAQTAHWLALVLFGILVASLHVPGNHALFTRLNESKIFVTPGDTNIENGNSLIVLARFAGPIPAKVELVVGESSGDARRLPLNKSLADPIFGGGLSEVTSNLTYHVEYGSSRTRDFQVTVFEYPRLERADAEVTFPAYTRLPVKRIEDTRRLSAVQGSRLDLALQLNKPVAAARLLIKNQNPIVLEVQTNRATASLKQMPLDLSASYELQLVDAEGRTNKAPALFVFDVLSNRPPELRLTSPRGDLRPSALEEISFEGTVWDDFGVEAYGLGYTVPGHETKFVELGTQVPAKEKRPFRYLLRLEELGAQPEQFVAWFAWADDIGPDGQVRRTAGDLYFGEIRPFEEVFRESQGMEGEGSPPGQENETDKLGELQKQIINATWKLQREHPSHGKSAAGPASPGTGTTPPKGQTSSVRQHSPPGVQSLPSIGGWVIYPMALPILAGQVEGKGDALGSRSNSPSKESSGRSRAPGYPDDAGVVRDAQAQALEKANATARRQQDPRGSALWEAATKEMERALASLNRATNSPSALPDALTAEQSAYQALLKLQAHEYQVSRSRSRSQSSSSRNEQMQRQLEQMDLTQSEDRYETQRQAQAQQTGERREQLQVMNRLQELARRQQDLNERLKELQTALQEARTDQERQDIQRRLKRLQEEEQQMLADVDELRQRMDRPENQSRMADERRQLEQTRNEVQRASEAAAQGQTSQALASGTRAQRQLQDLRDQMRKENSSQFADDLRNMRAQARELERRQQEIQKNLSDAGDSAPKSLSESADHKQAAEQLSQQKQRMTNLVDRATQVSQQAEDSEPLLSRQLYDSVRKFTQDNARNVKELQEELLNQRQMTRSIYDRLRDPAQQDGPKLMDLTSDLLRQDSLPQAKSAADRAQASISDLKKGVERAAESVIGDDTEALRLAHRELDQLTEQLQREMAQFEASETATNRQGTTNRVASGNQDANAQGQQAQGQQAQGQQAQGQQAQGQQAQGQQAQGQQAQGQQAQGQQAQGQQAQGQQAQGQQAQGQQAQGQQAQGQQAQGQQAQGQQAQSTGAPSKSGQSNQEPGQAGQRAVQPVAEPGQSDQSQEGQAAVPTGTTPGGQNGQQAAQATGSGRTGQNGTPRQGANPPGAVNPTSNGAQANSSGGGSSTDWNRLLDRNAPWAAGPLTGNEFGPWSDRLRDVEEMVELPDLRSEVAVARDRARVVRQEFRKEHKKPDWEVVRSQIMNPLVEVRDRIADELARRESTEALVPIDRDPVPTRYSDLVRRYYENLGKDK